MHFIKYLILFLVCHGLLACSTIVKSPNLPEFPLFDPTSLSSGIQVTQVITSKINDKPQVMLAAWSIEDGKMDLVGLTVTGQEILRLRYDGKDLAEVYNPSLTVPINGRTVISQIQFAYWPFEEIQKQLTNSSWQMIQDKKHRSIKYNNNLVTTIRAKSGTAHPAQYGQHWPELILESPKLNQNLTIKTVSAEAKK